MDSLKILEGITNKQMREEKREEDNKAKVSSWPG